MNQIYLPEISKDISEQIKRLIHLSLKANDIELAKQTEKEELYWDDTFYNLDKSSFWRSLDYKIKEKILIQLSTDILDEVSLIEIAGMFYGAKMNHLSESIDERILYSFITQEEAKHLCMIRPFTTRLYPESLPSFPLFIADIIQNEPRASAILLIQVLLEGWGIFYYSKLRDSSKNIELNQVFKNILQDEARHHATGISLVKSNLPSLSSELANRIISLCEMVRIGPFNLSKRVFEASGIQFDLSDVIKFLEEIEAIETTEKNLQVIHTQLSKALKEEDTKILQEKNIFQPYSINEMANFIFNSLNFEESSSNHQAHL